LEESRIINKIGLSSILSRTWKYLDQYHLYITYPIFEKEEGTKICWSCASRGHQSDRCHPPVWPVATLAHKFLVLRLNSRKVSHKIFGENLRSKISNWKWRIGTFEARSILPICPLCWIYQNRRYYRGRVGKTAKGSLARPRAVTGLTGARHRSNRWRPTSTRGSIVKISSFLPLLLLSPPLFTRSHPFPNRGGPSLLPSFTSLNSRGDVKIQPRERLKIGSKKIS
jgi:hypothetical protein